MPTTNSNEPPSSGTISPVPTSAIDLPPQTPPVVVAWARGNAALRVGDLKAPHGRSFGQKVLDAFKPNRAVSKNGMRTIVGLETALFLLIWFRSPFKVLPTPGETLEALRSLWMTQGLGPELISSFTLNVKALAWSTLITLALAYSTVIPVFRPLVAAVAKARFLSLAGFTLLFALLVNQGEPLKTSLLVFSVTVFFVTSMAAVIAAIPKSSFDYARTLRMSEWRVVWEVMILGTADKAFDALRQNAAIGWMMLTMVEGLVRSQGGVGTMLLNQSKAFRIPEIFAIQLVILGVGLMQDYLIGAVRRMVCPYADLTLERKEA